MPVNTRQLTPMAFVSDVTRSIAFYQHLGFSVGNTFTPEGEPAPTWAWLATGSAQLMITKASEPVISERQAVWFYLYVADVAQAHEDLSAAGLPVGPITSPFYAPKGEFRLVDPDGHVLMVTHT